MLVNGGKPGSEEMPEAKEKPESCEVSTLCVDDEPAIPIGGAAAKTSKRKMVKEAVQAGRTFC